MAVKRTKTEETKHAVTQALLEAVAQLEEVIDNLDLGATQSNDDFVNQIFEARDNLDDLANGIRRGQHDHHFPKAKAAKGGQQ